MRKFFYFVVVKLYAQYLRFLKKIGWKKIGENFWSFIFGQKLVHILVAVITLLIITMNLGAETRAEGLVDSAHKTILAELVKNENTEYQVDDQLIVETFDQERVISSVQQSYLDNLGAFRPQAIVDQGAQEEGGTDSVADNPMAGNVVQPELVATQKAKRERTEIVTYEIKPGDTISTIAQEYDISVSTILWENDLTVYDTIKPGMTLSILPVNGLSYDVKSGETLESIAKKYDIEQAKIIEYNKLASADQLRIGQKLILPGAKKINYPAPSQDAGRIADSGHNNKAISGFSVIKDIVVDDIIKAPEGKPVIGNKMLWPTSTTRITQYFSWRHTGLDLAAPVGTPIYAADAGTIEMEGWGTGYGNQIVVNHGGGKKTRYAHLSKFIAEKGETVSKGQKIAEMGSTGFSTGPHLHFEVIIDSVKYNPLSYIR